jgi:DNA-binding NarL/FixJ family response regulator
MYKILFIDEEDDAIDDFKDYADETTTSEQILIVAEFPQPTLEEMIQTIIKINPDAIITDFMLNEKKTSIKYGVEYNGIDLVKNFTSKRDGFPCFVMTSFDDDAVKESDDVNIVYIKEILHSEKSSNVKASFLEKVVSQIAHYRSRIESCENELKALIELRNNGKANISDENRIIVLDQFLEQSIDRQSSIPMEFKELSNTNRLNEILLKVDNLLSKIKKDD